MGTITKRVLKNGRVRWQVKVRRDGHRPLSRTFDRHADARAWDRETERALERGDIDPAATLANKSTLADLIKRYRREITPQKKSAEMEQRKLDIFARSGLANLAVANITPQLVSEWRDARAAEVAASTVNRELTILSHVFSTAQKEWATAPSWGNPVALTRRCKLSDQQRHGRNRRLEGDEEQRLLQAAADIEREYSTHGGQPAVPLHDLILCALETAMRRSEILRIRRADVDLQRRVLSVAPSKNDEPRSVPLSSQAVTILERQPPRFDGLIWNAHPHSVTHAFIRAAKLAGIKDCRFHDLRHEATSRLFERGLDILEVASITGHKDLRMLKRYTHHKAERLAAKLG